MGSGLGMQAVDTQTTATVSTRVPPDPIWPSLGLATTDTRFQIFPFHTYTTYSGVLALSFQLLSEFLHPSQYEV